MQEKWISNLTTIIVALITGSLAFYGGYYSAKLNYEAEVLKNKTALELNIINSKNEINKEKIKHFIARCESINSLSTELNAAYQAVFLGTPIAEKLEFEMKMKKLHIQSKQAQSYFGAQANTAYNVALKEIKNTDPNEMEQRYFAYIFGFNVELEACNKPDSLSPFAT